VLARSPSLVALNGCAITTDGPAANGIVAAGQGAFVRAANSTIRTSAASGNAEGASAGHGAMAATGGHVALDNVNIRTTGPDAAALVAVSGGTVIAHGGSVSADGSPVIRSAGLVQAFGIKGTASGSYAAVVEGHGTIDAVDTDLTGSTGGILFIGSPPGTPVTCNITGGTFTALTGPAFDIGRTTAKVTVRRAVVAGGTDRVLIRVADGGRLAFSSSGGVLSGDVISQGTTSLALRNGAALAGAINDAALDLDSSSTWSVTGPSTLTALTGATVIDGTITAITGNGHDVYYDPGLTANDWLGNGAYPLAGGGSLRPHATV
jgi:hypothetical protein